MYKSTAIYIVDYEEERAIIYGRCGHHRQALYIYVNDLRRPELAEKYCKLHYNANSARDRDVSDIHPETCLTP